MVARITDQMEGGATMSNHGLHVLHHSGNNCPVIGKRECLGDLLVDLLFSCATLLIIFSLSVTG
jgi:hypothetical protein